MKYSEFLEWSSRVPWELELFIDTTFSGVYLVAPLQGARENLPWWAIPVDKDAAGKLTGKEIKLKRREKKMLKLTDYAKMAAREYIQEAGHTELDARWIAEFFEESGVMEAYPEQNLIPFADMVQKELTKNAEQANKNMLRVLDKIARAPRKPSH